MKVYRIKDWDKHYENNRTRSMEVMRWVPIPNKHDGDGYTEMVDGPEGAAMYGAWVTITQVASKCHPRGTLLRANKTPHTFESLARVTRLPAEIIERAITKAVSPSVAWLELVDIDETQLDAQQCQVPVKVVTGRRGRMTKEGNRRERKYIKEVAAAPVHILLTHLNESTGSKFEPTESNLQFIRCRLEECKGDVDGCKQMINRQCALWLKDPDKRNYLRPETLFNKTKFAGYYGQRATPVQPKLDMLSGNGIL